MPVQVECSPGYRGEKTPHRFLLGTRSLAVTDIMDRWFGRDQSYYKVQADDGDVYILCYDSAQDRWELTLFSRRGYLGAGIPTNETPANGH